jgi:hypothetical protein
MSVSSSLVMNLELMVQDELSSLEWEDKSTYLTTRMIRGEISEDEFIEQAARDYEWSAMLRWDAQKEVIAQNQDSTLLCGAVVCGAASLLTPMGWVGLAALGVIQLGRMTYIDYTPAYKQKLYK